MKVSCNWQLTIYSKEHLNISLYNMEFVGTIPFSCLNKCFSTQASLKYESLSLVNFHFSNLLIGILISCYCGNILNLLLLDIFLLLTVEI